MGRQRHSKLHFLLEPWLPVRNCYPGRHIISFLELKGTKDFPCNVFYLNLPRQRWEKEGVVLGSGLGTGGAARIKSVSMISLQVAYGQIFRKILHPLGQTRLDLSEPLEQSLPLTDNLSQESFEIEHHTPSFYGDATTFQTAFSTRTVAASPELLPRATYHLVP
ncbi:hypothetical protein CDAR_453781 [Caerostris darwini]|uniref:Uncharacterized protein n=1 Tax=Caerostris darwini TaxID=1538125 RepID=A0AAV4UDJ9_9ARAC|nr:hypothetical protein CDAR_453781 [Caerostris darwini]